MKKVMILFLVLILVLAVGCAPKPVAIPSEETGPGERSVPEKPAVEEYKPVIEPNNFISVITNKYLNLTPGKIFLYEGKTEDGTERIEVHVTNETREVMGVKTIIIWDRVWLNAELIEDTKDWFAQDKEGNVWYFGEDSKELIDGKIVSTEGSWEAGIGGAQPGIVMKANPQVGDTYRQEYAKGEAEDMAEVLALGETVTVRYGTFTNCLKTKEWNPLEPGDEEHKYYCTEIGEVVLEVGLKDGERVELVDRATGEKKAPVEEPVERFEEGGISEEEAKVIAVRRVPGKVTDVAIEKKLGAPRWVVEIQPDGGGPETDVIIDMDTGEVLGLET